MKRAALIFLLAVFLPALILGGLALRSARDQQVVVEQQAVALRQQEVDSLATLIRAAVVEEHRNFKNSVTQMLGDSEAGDVARRFNQRLQEEWRGDVVGFSLTGEGRLLSPVTTRDQETAGAFLQENETFLEGRAEEEVYQAQVGVLAQVAPAPGKAMSGVRSRRESGPTESKAMAGADLDRTFADKAPQTETLSKKVKEVGSTVLSSPSAPRQAMTSKLRNVAPQQQAQNARQSFATSTLTTEEAGFPALTRSQSEGILARFAVQDELEILFWVRGGGDYIFGARLKPGQLHGLLDPLVTSTGHGEGATLALLDERGRLFARTGTGELADPAHPFVATEIGEILPHWEAALYLDDPGALGRSADVIKLTLGSLTAVALGAIAWGGIMIVRETRRQMEVVRKKTDFVSNVSHELKTPLTSIRMFSDLLVEEKVTDPARRQQYLRIISLEAERLTRLINNVLDFSRLERKQRTYQKRPVDLLPIIQRVWESQALPLEREGFSLEWKAEPGPYDVLCEEDALAQVLLNLLSNAEKYGGDDRQITLETKCAEGELQVSVLDRGPGVPRGESERIFEEFYRAHDSLSSGIQGSGLGLALARRIVEDHGGSLAYRERDGGGSIFTVHLPLVAKEPI